MNRDVPILCCTAEILANMALREGAGAQVRDVVMDEFHYYADRERGVAWQAGPEPCRCVANFLVFARVRFPPGNALATSAAGHERVSAYDQ